MFIWMILIITFVLTLTTIGIFLACPPALRALFAVQYLLGAVINFGISYIILIFLGQGMYAGVSNLSASLLFVLYLKWYVKRHDCKVNWEPKWGFIPNWRISWRE